MCTERERKEFSEERETERAREEKSESGSCARTTFLARGQRELERKLPSHCRICTPSTKMKDVIQKLLQQPIQGTKKSAQQPRN